MKIIVTSSSSELDSPIDRRFGRCAHFLLVDTETLETKAFPNPGINARGGAGIQASQFVINLKPNAVISGDFGPNAFDVLNSANIDMYLFNNQRTVREAVNDFKDGKLQKVNSSSGGRKQGHRRW